jgi:hypothetical protein
MVFPVVGGNESKGYEISNSIRFNDGDSPKLTRTNASGGDRQKFTISFWTKRTTIGATHIFFDAGTSTSTDSGSFSCSINSSDKLFIGGGATSFRQTNRLFRDVSAWYHIVIAVDTTDSTADDRIKIYVNGVQETSFTTNNAISLNQNTPVNESSKVHQICNRQKSSSLPFDGYMTEFHFIDGAQKAQTDFGEFDDNGVWIPKKYTGTYGTNGFFMEFKQTGTSANSSGIGADTSGNDNHFTPTNLAATDITEDTCTNNFCTMNPLYSYTGITFSEGNLQTNLGGSNHRWGTGTFFVESGKWYFECKVLSDNNLNSGPGVIAYGIDDPLTTEGGGAGSKAEGWIYLATSNGQLQHGNSTYGTASAATTNDILMVAFDVDNGKIWIGKNGTWSEGSNPSTGNGAVREDLGDASSGLFTPAISGYNENFQFNFGNPPFSISSGNTDGKYGNFEYEVPSGYYALCTKRLAEFG